MKRYLVKYKDNWADEMDIVGGIIMTEAEYKDYMKVAEIAFREEGDFITFGVGSNEEITYDTFEDFAKTITVFELTEEEFQTCVKLGLVYFGNFPEYIFDDYYTENDVYPQDYWNYR